MRESLFILSCAFLLAGCEPMVTIAGDQVDDQGRPVPAVVDVKGDALPGVAVAVKGTEHQAVTDALGQYRLRCRPGDITLAFIKTDYTPGRLELEVDEPRTVEPAAVTLWPLPPYKGVYLFKDFRYRQTTKTEPKPYKNEDGTPLFGTKVAPEVRTTRPEPLLIGYKLPSYDVRLARLRDQEASPLGTAGQGDNAFRESIWAPAGAIGVMANPIDEVDRLLLQFQPAEPLEPGVYALHYGALNGYTSTDPFIYLFRVAAPGAPEGEAPEGEGASEEGETNAAG